MAGPEYGKIRWIDDYIDAPASAEFILRRMSYCIRFERYEGSKKSFTLWEFPLRALNKKHYKDTLTLCRQMIDSHKTIWVEKPFWKYPD